MTRMLLTLLIALTLGLSPIAVGTGWAQAVSVDATSFMKRMDAIEARLSAAEAHRGSGGGAGSTTSAYTAGDLERRMDEIETESSQIHGANERATQAIERLAKRMDDYTKDMDMRMSDLEAKVEAQSKVAATPAAVTPVEAAAVEAPVVAPAAATPAPAKAAAGIPADMSASDHYNKAYAYLTATDYKNAQVWFEEFLKRHPTNALADNAYYWLGEVYLVQNNPLAAVVKFRDGIKAFPKGSKVTADLFKMGVALEQLKQPDRARAAWETLIKDYPTAPEAARAKDKLVTLKKA